MSPIVGALAFLLALYRVFDRFHLALRLKDLERVAQRAGAADRLAELVGEAGQQRIAAQRAAAVGDLVPDHVGHREMLEQSDDVGETLVEGEDVDIGRVDRAAMDAVQDRMRGLVGDDVL